MIEMILLFYIYVIGSAEIKEEGREFGPDVLKIWRFDYNHNIIVYYYTRIMCDVIFLILSFLV